MEDGWELTSELTSNKYLLKYSIKFHTKLINNFFEVFSQTLHNLQGSRRNTIQWCLQNYVVNGLELMSELTSKWINFKILKQIYH